MEINVLPVVPHFLKRRLKRRKKTFQKFTVRRAVRRNIPPENPFHLSVHTGHDFRRRVRSPLGKKMRDFQILYPAFLAERRPPFQSRKVKGILPLRSGNAHQLNRWPLPSHLRVERRRKDRRQQHINAVTASCLLDKPFQYRPVSLA